jgi:hypothetical protein
MSPSSREEVHAWSVRVSGIIGPVMEDRYRATVNEFEAMQRRETTVTEQYMLDFINRMEYVIEVDSVDYERWLELRGVGFGVNVEDTQATQAFWRNRFDNDVRCFKGFQRAIGADRAREFLLCTVSR